MYIKYNFFIIYYSYSYYGVFFLLIQGYINITFNLLIFTFIKLNIFVYNIYIYY